MLGSLLYLLLPPPWPAGEPACSIFIMRDRCGKFTMMLLTFLNISQQRDSSWSPKLNLPKVGGRGDHKKLINITHNMTHRKSLSLTGLADPILHLFHLTINIFWQRWHSLHKDINIFQQRRHSLHIVICKVEVLPNPGKHHHQENKSQARGNPHLLSGCLYKAPPYSQLCRVNAELARVLFNNLDMIGENKIDIWLVVVTVTSIFLIAI